MTQYIAVLAFRALAHRRAADDMNFLRSYSRWNYDGLHVDNMAKESERNPPFAWLTLRLYCRGFLVHSLNSANYGSKLSILKADQIADLEFASNRSFGRRFGCGRRVLDFCVDHWQIALIERSIGNSSVSQSAFCFVNGQVASAHRYYAAGAGAAVIHIEESHQHSVVQLLPYRQDAARLVVEHSDGVTQAIKVERLRSRQISDQKIKLFEIHEAPDGHFKCLYSRPVKLLQAGWGNYQSSSPKRARRAATSLQRRGADGGSDVGAHRISTVSEVRLCSGCEDWSRIGDAQARIGFTSPELLWQVLTAKRWELLKSMCSAGPMSIREVARRVGRDVKAVHSDVTALLDAGVLTRAPGGGVEFPFDSIKVEFMLRSA